MSAQRDCIHGHLARSCELCAAQNDHATACEQIDRLRADLAAERAAFSVAIEGLHRCRIELREIEKTIDDPRVHISITIEEWCREMRAENERLKSLLRRYRCETPLGHQPHMIAAEVDAALKEE